jgi:hypothetical protein
MTVPPRFTRMEELLGIKGDLKNRHLLMVKQWSVEGAARVISAIVATMNLISIPLTFLCTFELAVLGRSLTLIRVPTAGHIRHTSFRHYFVRISPNPMVSAEELFETRGRDGFVCTVGAM